MVYNSLEWNELIVKLLTVKNNFEFQRVYKRGRSVPGAYIVMYRLKNDLGCNRFGITVSKKVGKAVVRNRVRRLIRQSIVNQFNRFEGNYDYIIVARVRANKASLFDVEKNLRYLISTIDKKKSGNKTKSDRKKNKK